MELPVERIPTLVAGAGTLLFGVIIVAMSPRSPLHRAFALFCVLRGGMLGLHAFSSPYTDMQGRLSVYLLIALPFAAWWLCHVFLRQHRRLRPLDVRLAGGLLAGVLLVEAAYLADHGLFYDANGPLQVFFTLQFVAYAAVGFAVASKYRTCPPGPGRRALFPLALAFVAEPTYWVAANAYLIFSGSWSNMMDVADAASIIAAGALAIATAARISRARSHPQLDHDRERFIAIQGLALASGLATLALAFWAPTFGRIPPLFLLNAAWTLFLVAATTYAIVRYKLFTIDLRVKTFIRHGSTAALEGGLFVIVSELLEDRVASEGLIPLVAALAIAAGLYPVSRLTRRIADRLMPGVVDNDAYRVQRRRDIYRAALHQAWADGSVTPGEKAALDALWKSLGISGREAKELEQELRPQAPSRDSPVGAGTA